MSGILGSIMGAASDAVGSLATLTKKGDTKQSQSAESAQAAFSSLLALAMNSKAQPAPATPTTTEGTSELADGEGDDTTATGEVDGSAKGSLATVGAGVAATAVAASATDVIGVEGAAPVAAGEALAAAIPVDPTGVHSGMDGLNPQFRERLERVVSRMRTEYGHEVTVTETLRDQTRQNFLFGQGRTRPGPVVTWTRSSNHTVGRAADLMIDGTYNNPIGYKHLAQIAAEEGLRTLGPRDPGHVELPGGKMSAPQPLIETVQITPARTQPGGMAAVAQVAEVAQVARVAQVAQVAQVAEVARVAQPGAVATQVRPVPADTGARQETGSENAGGSGSGEGRPDLVRVDGLAQRGTFGTTAAEALTRAAGLDAGSRVAQIASLQDDAAAGPVNQVLLRLDNAAGGEDRIRIDLRGAAVGASMDMASNADAERMTSKLGDLQRALESRGLEAESLRVRSANPRDAAELIRMSTTTLETDMQRSNLGSRNSGSDPSARDRWEAMEQERSRREDENPREGNRGNPKQEKK